MDFLASKASEMHLKSTKNLKVLWGHAPRHPYRSCLAAAVCPKFLCPTNCVLATPLPQLDAGVIMHYLSQLLGSS